MADRPDPIDKSTIGSSQRSIAQATIRQIIPVFNELVQYTRALEKRVQALEEGEATSEGLALSDVLDAHVADKLRAAGYETPRAVRAASDEDLLDVPHIGTNRLDTIRTALS